MDLGKFTYEVFGWRNKKEYVSLGTFETYLSIHDCFDMCVQAFDDGNCPEGLFIRRIV